MRCILTLSSFPIQIPTLLFVREYIEHIQGHRLDLHLALRNQMMGEGICPLRLIFGAPGPPSAHWSTKTFNFLFAGSSVRALWYVCIREITKISRRTRSSVGHAGSDHTGAKKNSLPGGGGNFHRYFSLLVENLNVVSLPMSICTHFIEDSLAAGSNSTSGVGGSPYRWPSCLAATVKYGIQLPSFSNATCWVKETILWFESESSA